MTITKSILQWTEAVDAIRDAQSILIVTHVSPDGDAIGSLLGLFHSLRHLGKQVTLADDDGMPEYLRFLPGAEFVVELLAAGEWDLMISTDASDEERTGQVGAYGREHSKRVLNLDHHATNTLFGDVHLVDVDAVSATEVVFNLLPHLQCPLDRDTARTLLTGLVTDTLGFRTSNVTARTLQIAQQLMEAGASLTEVTARTLDSRSYEEISLWKRALPSVEMDGEVIHAVVRLQDVAYAGLDKVTDGGLVGFLNQVDQAMIAVVFKEQPDNQVELSIRAKRGYDVSAVALALGGGGHKQAAGATVDGTVGEVKARVLPLLHEAARKGMLEIV